MTTKQRMLDSGLPEVGVTFDLGADPTNDELLLARELIADATRATKHLPGMHNQMSHGRGGSAPDTGGSTGGETPAALSAGQKEVEEYIDMVAGFQKQHSAGVGLKYGGAEHIVQELGQFDETQPRPAGIKQGKMKECYTNAFNLMQSNPDKYTYVEGVAYPKGLIPMNHAWCVDNAGKVVDPTWKNQETTAYKGVHLNHTFVTRTVLSKKSYQVFDFMSKEGQDMLTNGLPEEALVR